MSRRELHITLLSEGTFGRGDGVAGLLDQEIEHDERTGLPFIRGRVIKGLLVEECANILYSLSRSQVAAGVSETLEKAAGFLYGEPGSTLNTQASMQVGDARFPEKLQEALVYAIEEDRSLKPSEVLDSLTTIRRQTAVDDGSGTPDEGSLRATRVLLRGTTLVAELTFDEKPEEAALALLAACIGSWRRGGTGRNRGRGRVQAYLDSEAAQATHLQAFCDLVGKEEESK